MPLTLRLHGDSRPRQHGRNCIVCIHQIQNDRLLVQSPRRALSGEASHEACSMPILVRARLVGQSVMDRRFFGLVAWSGAGPPRTRWLSPPPWGPQAQPGCPSPPTPVGVRGVLCSGSLAGGGIRSGASLVLRWRIRGLIDQAPIDQADDVVAERGPQARRAAGRSARARAGGRPCLRAKVWGGFGSASRWRING
jgi:hypothetical protein